MPRYAQRETHLHYICTCLSFARQISAWYYQFIQRLPAFRTGTCFGPERREGLIIDIVCRHGARATKEACVFARDGWKPYSLPPTACSLTANR